ncbi:hypothetical protein Hanom_Chr01g00062671 [Helianthus anomalus]
MLKNMATSAEKKALSKLSDEDAAYRIITQASLLVTSLPDSIECWAASVSKNDELAASLQKKDEELKTSQEDLVAFQVKVADLEGQLLSSQANMDDEMRKVEVYARQLSDFNNHLAKEKAEFWIERVKYRQEQVYDEAITEELMQQVKQLKEERKWFNLHLARIYSEAMVHGRHTGLVAAVYVMEALSYPYVEALSQMVDCPMAELEALEPEGLNKELCEELLSVASVKLALFETSNEKSGDG